MEKRGYIYIGLLFLFIGGITLYVILFVWRQ